MRMFPRYTLLFRLRCGFHIKSNNYSTEGGNRKLQSLINKWMTAYEDFVGLTLVKAAQNNVLLKETKFRSCQEERRQKQQVLNNVQAHLKTITAELDKTNKSDERYLDIVKREHSVIREEHRILEEINLQEKQERESFAMLSTAVRESHEKERAQAEKTKYWSIIGSVIGAFIGISGSTVNNYMRMRNMKEIVDTSLASNSELKELSGELCSAVQTQFNTVDSFLDELRTAVNTNNSAGVRSSPRSRSAEKPNVQLMQQTDKILDTLAKQEHVLNMEIQEVKKILGLNRKERNDSSVVYVGPEVKKLLQKTEDNLEWKIKMTSLASATFVYGALALTIPIILSFFKGS